MKLLSTCIDLEASWLNQIRLKRQIFHIYSYDSYEDILSIDGYAIIRIAPEVMYLVRELMWGEKSSNEVKITIVYVVGKQRGSYNRCIKLGTVCLSLHKEWEGQLTLKAIWKTMWKKICVEYFKNICICIKNINGGPKY